MSSFFGGGTRRAGGSTLDLSQYAPGENEPMVPRHIELTNSMLSRVIKRLHFPLEIMSVCFRWHAAYPLGLRKLKGMMAERGVLVDHATVHRWALKVPPLLAAVFRRRKHSVGSS